MKNIPAKIYLQVDADGETPEDFNDLEVSWASNKINDNDIEYVLAPVPSTTEAGGWISVEDGLPDGRMDTCLVFNSGGLLHKQHIAIAQYFQQIGGFVSPTHDYKVTHWQPLPSPPQSINQQ